MKIVPILRNHVRGTGILCSSVLATKISGGHIAAITRVVPLTFEQSGGRTGISIIACGGGWARKLDCTLDSFG
jgi:hypothetical protein